MLQLESQPKGRMSEETSSSRPATRLVVVSHTPHYLRQGEVVGWGPTLRELDYLATLFDSVVHVAPLYREPAPDSATPYGSTNITLRPVPPSGGVRLIEKLTIPIRWPQYCAALWRECNRADVVHVRCPANISLLAVLLLPLMRRHRARWIKYAGSWRPASPDALSYRFQRWWLRRTTHGAKVTINGEWEEKGEHIHSFLNPCLTEVEIQEGARAASSKELRSPIQMLYVGGIEAAKGAGRAIEIAGELYRRGIDATLDVVGDGPDRIRFLERARELGIDRRVTFHGWVARQEVPRFYRDSHIILLPSDSEGWPKVLSEAMAYGAVPLASDVGSIPQILQQCTCGSTFSKEDTDGFADAVLAHVRDPARWKEECDRGVKSAPMFGYAAYLERVRALLDLDEVCPPASMQPCETDTAAKS